MRIVALINESEVVDLSIVAMATGAELERILRHLGLWRNSIRVLPERAPAKLVDRILEPWLEDPFPDCHTEPVMAYANN